MRRSIIAGALCVLALGATGHAQDNADALIAACDRAAAGPLDINRPAGIPGIQLGLIAPATAIPACEAAAKAAPSNARIIYQLGRAYQAAKTYEAAIAQYAKADGLGYVAATHNLGILHQGGAGTRPDPDKARLLLEKAAIAGFPASMLVLGMMYEQGNGVAKNATRSRQWYEMAAAAGEPNAKKKIEQLQASRGAIFKTLATSPTGVIIGSKDADVTITEFFDYNETYSPELASGIKQLLSTDKKVRIVLLHVPILGSDSIGASRVSVAASRQLSADAFLKLHLALLASRSKVNEQKAMAIARRFRLDQGRLKADMNSEQVKQDIADSFSVMQALAINAIPTFVIGDEVLVGVASLPQLPTRIAAMRKCGKTRC